MEEKQIIAQLKGLRQTRPNQEWKENTKSYILGTIEPHENIFSGVFSMSSFKMPKLQPAMIIPALMVVFVGIGISSHFYFNSSENIAEIPYENQTASYLVLAETRLAQIQSPEDIEAISEMLGKATDSLSSLPKDPAVTAKVVESLANINKKMEELDNENTEGIEALKEQAGVLTVKTTAVLEGNIKDTTAELNKLLVENEMNNLETIYSLTEEQEELFEEIKLDYKNENYGQAWEKILDLQK